MKKDLPKAYTPKVYEDKIYKRWEKSGYFNPDVCVRKGVCGKDELLAYFRELLAHNPDWVWTQIEPIPMEGGFLNKWSAKIPVGSKTIECIGVCFLQFNDDGLIRRNEVYFDRSELISEIHEYQKSK